MNEILEAIEYPPIVYSVTDDALTQLRERYDTIPDASTDIGYAESRKAVTELTKFRTTVEAERKRLKKPALEYGRCIDKEAKRITNVLTEIEAPHRKAKEEKDAELRAIEQKRRDDINTRIKAMGDLCMVAYGKSSSEIDADIDELCGINVTDESLFGEYCDEAATIQQESLDRLHVLLEAAKANEKAQEELEAARVAVEIQRKALAADKAALEEIIGKDEIFPDGSPLDQTAEKSDAIDWLSELMEEDNKGKQVQAKRVLSAETQALRALQTIIPTSAFEVLGYIIEGNVPHVYFDDSGPAVGR